MRNFVNIKVDREGGPTWTGFTWRSGSDDGRGRTADERLADSAGTSFYGGTYSRSRGRYGRASLPSVLSQIARRGSKIASGSRRSRPHLFKPWHKRSDDAGHRVQS